MKAIVSLTNEETIMYASIYNKLHIATKNMSQKDMFNNYSQKSGYAHYTFSGEITEELIKQLGYDPSSEDIIMLVDRGFSHFGAGCSIAGRKFSGRVNTD